MGIENVDEFVLWFLALKISVVLGVRISVVGAQVLDNDFLLRIESLSDSSKPNGFGIASFF